MTSAERDRSLENPSFAYTIPARFYLVLERLKLKADEQTARRPVCLPNIIFIISCHVMPCHIISHHIISTVKFSTLASFRRTIHNVDFSRFIKFS